MICAEGVTVARGRRVLLENLDLEVRAGELIHVAGPNGCGKSSLLRVLAGVVEPRRGRVTRRVSCAFVPERVALPAAMRAHRWLSIAGAREAPLQADVDRRCGALSKGQLQRLALAAALETVRERPALLALDEPWAGLDARARAALSHELADVAARGSAVIFTDHTRAATLRETRTIQLGAEVEPAAPTRARVVLTRGKERVALDVEAPELAARLGEGWAVRDAEPLP